MDQDGYLLVCLHLSESYGNCKRSQITVRVNRLVLMAFNPIKNSELFEAHHKDKIRTNNYIGNLEWMLVDDHIRESILTRPYRNLKGSNNPMSTITEEQAKEISNYIKLKQYSFKEIADKLNISTNIVYSIAHNCTWSHITDIKETDIRVSPAFTDDEIENICKFFESNDINDLNKYPSLNSIYRDCFITLGLNKKYDLNEKRKTMYRLLYKIKRNHDRITQKYDYNCNR